MKLTNSVKNLDAKLLETEPSKSLLQILYEQFSNYLLHGGYLTAMNDLAKDGEIAKATLDTYADWIRGDVIKHGKSDHHCREFFTAMIKRLNSQITWTALAKDFAAAEERVFFLKELMLIVSEESIIHFRQQGS